MIAEADAYKGLKDIFSDVFLRDDIVLTPELTAADVDGWDSFKQIEIVMGVEEIFGVKFQTRDLDSMATLGDLVKLIVAKG
jgi:acyl carrier protein